MKFTHQMRIIGSGTLSLAQRMCAVRITKSVGESIEEMLNDLTAEGELATLESISIQGEATCESDVSADPGVVIVLVVSDTEPNVHQVGLADDPTPLTALEAMCPAEFAYQILQTPQRGADKQTRGSADLEIHYPITVNLNVPPKWRQMGILQSDEHLDEPGKRSWIYAIFLGARALTANSNVSFEGWMTLRYNVEGYNQNLSRLLEGIEE